MPEPGPKPAALVPLKDTVIEPLSVLAIGGISCRGSPVCKLSVERYDEIHALSWQGRAKWSVNHNIKDC